MLEEEFVTTSTLGRANASLKPDKNLLNSKFEQYKYTSGREHEITYRALQHAPHRTSLTDSDYSYQMTRTSCLFNHLVASPAGDQFYYVTYREGRSYTLINAGEDRQVAEFENSEKLMFNVSVVWSDTDTLVLCVGSDLYLLTVVSPSTVKQKTKQKLDFQCLLLSSFQRDGTIYLVVCYKADNVFIHQILKQNDAGLFEATTSIKQSGIARFVAVKDDLLTLISEGKLLVSEPEQQEQEATSEDPEKTLEKLPKKEEEEEKNYTWTQTMEDVEISILLPSGILKTDLTVEIGLDSLEVRTKGGQELFKSKLFSKVEPKESTWHMSPDQKKVEVTLAKYQEAHNWAHLVDTPHYDTSGNLLSQISDLSEEELRNMMRRMESLSEYTSDRVDKSPLYTPHRDLEECDELDGQQVLLSGFSIGPHQVKHKFLVELSPGTLLFSDADRGFVVSHSVDACYYKVADLDSPWLHADTFHAFNMVQATKTQKKFIVTDSSRKYAAIVDISRHVYIYNSSRDSSYGKLLVMTLDNSDDSEILGVFPRKDSIVLLTEKYLITIKFSL